MPDVKVSVKRPKSFFLKGKSLVGEDFTFEPTDQLARVMLHEIDHLNGILILTKGNINANRKNLKILEEMERKYKNWKERLEKKENKYEKPTLIQQK